MAQSLIQAITFDAAGTLIHLSEPVGVSYSRIAAEFGIGANAHDLGIAFGAVWKRTPLPFSLKNRANVSDEKAWWRRLVLDTFLEVGIRFPDDEIFERFFEALYFHFESPGTWRADPDAIATLESLSTRFRCIVLSNFDGRLRRILEDLNLLGYFETCLLSSELGGLKTGSNRFRSGRQPTPTPTGTNHSCRR